MSAWISWKKRPLNRSFLEDSSMIRHYLWKYRSWVGIGLFALIIVNLIDILPPLFLKYVVDIVVERRAPSLLAWAAGVYVAVSIVQSVGRYAWRMYLIRASILAGRDIRKKFVHHIVRLSSSFFDRKPMGSLMSLATQDVEAVRQAIGSGVLVLADGLFYLLTVPVAMAILSPRLTILACLPLPLVPWIVLKREKEIHRRFEKVQECFGRISALVQENLHGVRVVKAFAREDGQLDRIRDIGTEYMKLNLSLAAVQCGLGPLMDLCMSTGMVILLYVGGETMISDPKSAITLGTFVAFQRYIQKMVWPMAAVGLAVSYYQKGASSSNRLKEILNTQTDVPDPPCPIVPSKKEGRVEFRNLWFQFPGTDAPVLKGIDLMIEPSERVAFVGSIGAGKSALLSLLPRLYPVEKGQLWVDGVDINDWPIEELRRQIGYVGQDVFLFSGTVKDNLGFGDYPVISSAEDAARLAEVHDEILKFSDSYRTRLGELGVNLSGGQKQRLTIARALVLQPLILVLDDALSSVDVQKEEKILKALRSRPGRNTELIAAHRISTVKDADRIVVLKSGKISQLGSHSQLIRRKGGDYWRFYEQQMFKEELESYGHEFQ